MWVGWRQAGREGGSAAYCARRRRGKGSRWVAPAGGPRSGPEHWKPRRACSVWQGPTASRICETEGAGSDCNGRRRAERCPTQPREVLTDVRAGWGVFPTRHARRSVMAQRRSRVGGSQMGVGQNLRQIPPPVQGSMQHRCPELHPHPHSPGGGAQEGSVHDSIG